MKKIWIFGSKSRLLLRRENDVTINYQKIKNILLNNIMGFGKWVKEKYTEIFFVICNDLTKIQYIDSEKKIENICWWSFGRWENPYINASASYWYRNFRNLAFRSFDYIWIRAFRNNDENAKLLKDLSNHIWIDICPLRKSRNWKILSK